MQLTPTAQQGHPLQSSINQGETMQEGQTKEKEENNIPCINKTQPL